MCATSSTSHVMSRPAVVVGIATTGRPKIVHDTLLQLASLQNGPDAVVLSIADAQDFDATQLPQMPFPLQVLESPKGLCDQRNTILKHVDPDCILLFLDDDFLIADGFIDATRDAFEDDPSIVMTTGSVLADGILGPGMTHADGLAHLAKATRPKGTPTRSETYNGYGCNMAIRMSVVHANGLSFDTSLPRYAWLEDVDFSRMLATYGRVVKDSHMRGVHLGTKTGRSRGVPLGYSQVANPIFLIRKGTMAPKRALRLMFRNILANLAKTLRPEPWVDRPGRVRGNFLALKDLITGRIAPSRILDL